MFMASLFCSNLFYWIDDSFIKQGFSPPPPPQQIRGMHPLAASWRYDCIRHRILFEIVIFVNFRRKGTILTRTIYDSCRSRKLSVMIFFCSFRHGHPRRWLVHFAILCPLIGLLLWPLVSDRELTKSPQGWLLHQIYIRLIKNIAILFLTNIKQRIQCRVVSCRVVSCRVVT